MPIERVSFGRHRYVPPPAPPIRPATRRGIITRAIDQVVAIPKSKPWRNRALLDLAKGMPCLLRVPGVCSGGTETTVAAHSNLAIHGKSAGCKSSDAFSVWACWTCHRWLDQGLELADIKASAFMAAHILQVLHWRQIATDSTEPPRARRACIAALTQLNALPIPTL